MKDILFQKFVTSCSKIHFQQHMWFCTECQKTLLLIVLDGCTGFVTIKFTRVSQKVSAHNFYNLVQQQQRPYNYIIFQHSPLTLQYTCSSVPEASG